MIFPMRTARFLVPLAGAASTLVAAAMSPAEVERHLGSARLDVARAVEAQRVLDLGPARLSLLEGTLIPVAEIPGRTVEVLFDGRARFELRPPDAIETGQLEMLAGTRQIDVTVRQAVLVMADEQAATDLLSGAPVRPSDDTVARLESLFRDWRDVLGTRGAASSDVVFAAALEDQPSAGYWAAWLRSIELGSLVFEIDPRRGEQVRFGRLEIAPPAAPPEEGEGDEEDPGGEEDEDDDDPRVERFLWVSTCLRSADGTPIHGSEGFEAEHYDLDVSVDPDSAGEVEAKIQLRGETDGTRVVHMSLLKGLDVLEIEDLQQRPLVWRRDGHALDVALAEPLDRGQRTKLTVRYRGSLVKEVHDRVWVVRHTGLWYPRAGTVDRATYEATFRWPDDVQLFASGTVTDEGEDGGQRWQRRALTVPSLGFSFEIGDFEVVVEQFGPVELTVGFNKHLHPYPDDAIRRDVMSVVKASLAFYSQTFGMYPLKQLTVVTVPRDVSQGYLGFVTYSHSLLFEPWNQPRQALRKALGNMPPEERRVEVLAHELAHQWWGNRVGWQSYRDQWLSEALADYSAMLFSKKLWPDSGDYVARHARRWQAMLSDRTPNGIRYAAAGPVVLGSRLGQHGYGAYVSVVYYKGAVVFDTLALVLGEQPLSDMLRELAGAVDFRVLSTETFLRAVEHMAGVDLQRFARQFVYGTGMPEVYYRYRIERSGAGWVVRGQTRQLPALGYRYQVRREPDAGWTIERRPVESGAPPVWALAVPFQIALRDAAGESGSTESGIGGRLTLSEPVASFEIPLSREPRELWLDQRGEVLAEFICENREPLTAKRRLAWRLASLGEHAAAERTLAEALELADKGAPDARDWLTGAKLHLQAARLSLDRGDPEAAKAELKVVDRLLGPESESLRLQRTVLAARAELLGNRLRAAFDVVERWIDDIGLIWETAPHDESGPSREELMVELHLALAVAAWETGRADMAREALGYARERGADPGPLGALLHADPSASP